ncbi:hypothetical protein, partial [Tateyamaria pelophila]|uniref:hypothetical protein n=1 Tax=Tateyamaria pelophila TaxID=328415 RepID=UPI001CBC86F5
DATHPKALSALNSSELDGTRHSYAAFSMGCKRHDAKRDCPAVIVGIKIKHLIHPYGKGGHNN